MKSNPVLPLDLLQGAVGQRVLRVEPREGRDYGQFATSGTDPAVTTSNVIAPTSNNFPLDLRNLGRVKLMRLEMFAESRLTDFEVATIDKDGVQWIISTVYVPQGNPDAFLYGTPRGNAQRILSDNHPYFEANAARGGFVISLKEPMMFPRGFYVRRYNTEAVQRSFLVRAEWMVYV